MENVKIQKSWSERFNDFIYLYKEGGIKGKLCAIGIVLLVITLMLGCVVMSIAIFPIFALCDKRYRNNLKKWALGTLIWSCTTVPFVYFVIL